MSFFTSYSFFSVSSEVAGSIAMSVSFSSDNRLCNIILTPRTLTPTPAQLLICHRRAAYKRGGKPRAKLSVYTFYVPRRCPCRITLTLFACPSQILFFQVLYLHCGVQEPFTYRSDVYIYVSLIEVFSRMRCALMSCTAISPTRMISLSPSL